MINKQKTYMAKKESVEKKWYLFDAKDYILGRLASKIAVILMGKHKPIYTPHVDTGDYVVVINAEKIKVTGKKLKDKYYYFWSGYPGGLKKIPLEVMLERHPEKILYLAVKRMLPKSKLGRKMLKKLKIHTGPDHPYKAQSPIPWETWEKSVKKVIKK